MRKRVSVGYSLEGKRMLSMSETETYTGLGRNAARKLAENAGAVRKYGRRVLIDRTLIDKALDTMPVAAAAAAEN